MPNIDIDKLTKIVESSNINFLIGAGLSQPFLPILGNIETRLSQESSQSARIVIYKEYFEKVMLPNLGIIKSTLGADAKYQSTYLNYKKFFDLISYILLKRKNTILSKQANIFTTNIDILMETALEESGLSYNDGFSGQLNPEFRLSNFKVSLLKRSLHFENTSEIPVFNLIKCHGSLTWKRKDKDIFFSKLEQINPDLLTKSDTDFDSGYKEIIVVNPEPKKLQESVMDVIYYELLRMYSSELEKENTVLFVMGFSMEDDHIREITIRSANSNPTLKIYIFCFSQAGGERMREKMKLGELKYGNIEIIAPEDDTPDNKYSLDLVNKVVFEQIVEKYNSPEHHGE